jgi:hypothetical protein
LRSARHRSTTPRAVALVSALVAMLYPVVLHACPVCAGREDAGPWRGIFLAMFIFFPFAVVAAVVRFVRSEERRAGDRDVAPGEKPTVNAVP